MAETLGDRRRLGRVYAYRVSNYRLAADWRRAVESGQRALDLAISEGDFALRVMSSELLGLMLQSVGEYRRSAELLRWTVASLDGKPIHERFGLGGPPASTSRAFLAVTLAHLGEFPEAIAHGEEALRLAELLAHPYSQVIAHLWLGDVLLCRGEVKRAATVLERGVWLAEASDLPQPVVLATARLGAAYVMDGRTVDGLSMIERSVGEAESRGWLGPAALLRGWLARAYLESGQIEEAKRAAEETLDLAETQAPCGKEAYSHHLIGEIAARSEPPGDDAAEQQYRTARALAEELGMRPLQAHCHLSLGKLYRRSGRPDEARAELETAVAMLREMGMAFWLPEAESELAQAHGSVPGEHVG